MKKVTEIVAELAAGAVAEQGCELWDVEYVREAGQWFLRLYLDKEGGVDLDACEKFHRAIDPILDEVDPTFGAPYTLNVSSPGLDRPLKTARDFQKKMGQKVEVKLFAPMRGKKLFEAVLIGYDGNCVELDDNGEKIKLELSKVAKICLAIDFDGLF